MTLSLSAASFLNSLGIQQTQIALQSQMDTWARQQALPFIKVIVPPEHIFTVEKITAEKVAAGYLITGEGLLNMILANNGGGKAGLVNINWVTDLNTNSNLDVDKMQFGDLPGSLPNTIEAQTPIKIQLGLKASIPYDGNATGKSDYQLGKYWKAALQSNPNHLVITFSNTDPINIEIVDIQLVMPEVSYQPNPPSPFPVTNKTELGTVCYSTRGRKYEVRIKKGDGQEASILIGDDTCISYPVGSYRLTDINEIRSGTGLALEVAPRLIKRDFSVIADQAVASDFPERSSSALWPTDWQNVSFDSVAVLALITGLMITLVSTFSGLVGKLRVIESGNFMLWYTNEDGQQIPMHKQWVQLRPWGVKIKLGLRSGKPVTLFLKKEQNRSYKLELVKPFPRGYRISRRSINIKEGVTVNMEPIFHGLPDDNLYSVQYTTGIKSPFETWIRNASQK